MDTYHFPPIKRGNTLQPPPMQYLQCSSPGSCPHEPAGPHEPIDISGYTITANLMDPTNKKNVHTWTTAGDSPTIDMSQAAQGIFRLHNWDANVPCKTYIGDIDFTTPAGVKDTFCNLKLPVVDAY